MMTEEQRELLVRLMTPDTLSNEGDLRHLVRLLRRRITKPQRVAVWDNGQEYSDWSMSFIRVGDQSDEQITVALRQVYGSDGELIAVVDVYGEDWRSTGSPQHLGVIVSPRGVMDYPHIWRPFKAQLEEDWATSEVKARFFWDAERCIVDRYVRGVDSTIACQAFDVVDPNNPPDLDALCAHHLPLMKAQEKRALLALEPPSGIPIR